VTAGTGHSRSANAIASVARGVHSSDMSHCERCRSASGALRYWQW
jgi:hypothetical protein